MQNELEGSRRFVEFTRNQFPAGKGGRKGVDECLENVTAVTFWRIVSQEVLGMLAGKDRGFSTIHRQKGQRTFFLLENCSRRGGGITKTFP